jgi:hypothetical protein
VLAPFIIFAAIQFLALVCLMAFSVPPLSTVMVPVVAGLGGEDALHYPMHMVMLPRLYHQLYLPLAVFVGFALFGWGVWLMMDHYDRTGEDVPRRSKSQFRKLIPSTMVVGCVFVAVVTAIQLVSSALAAALENPWAGRALWVGAMALVLLFQALTIYSVYFLVNSTGNPATAIAESVRFGRSHLPLTTALVFTVFLIHLPVNYLAQRADRVVLKFNPELVFVLLAVGIVLEIATNYFLFASTTSVAASVKREGI